MTTVSEFRQLGLASDAPKSAASSPKAVGPSAECVAAYQAALDAADVTGRLEVIHTELSHIDRQLLAAYQLPRRERRAMRRAWLARQREVENDLQHALLDHITRARRR